jgi:hypothetical protein
MMRNVKISSRAKKLAIWVHMAASAPGTRVSQMPPMAESAVSAAGVVL